MKKFLSNLIDWLGFCLIICNGLALIVMLIAIAIGSGDALRNSVHGWHGSHVLFVMFGLPLLWAFVCMALDSAVNKFNAKV
jgi:hypothetical protein|tara:strand:- start:95 stop:337 length:243 start_codon:yes stop_codon:yes gene_type:complete